ncbi:glycosyltransferase [Nocardioides jensenii]|uniref:glycosyltransferase n=1 Tax=Nocardioides jensenii TaxID=1843 RepID=UPI00082DE41D|nr:glycosyltransferase [Nocardioides jensenii]
MTLPAHALVVTVVHHPEDARIRHRQIASLLEAGWQVTYAAPFSGYGLPIPPSTEQLRSIDVPRAVGTARLASMRAARALLDRRGDDHDVVLLHDPELLLAVGSFHHPHVVWDVHEDTAAAISLKPWLPAGLGRPAAWAVRRIERRAERRHHLLLAEDAYQSRFRKRHPVVPNTTRVPASPPPPDDPRVVYVGHLSRARGVHELVELSRLLAPSGIAVQAIGHADQAATAALTAPSSQVDWLGFLPHDEAMKHVDGALAGLSLLHDEPNYRHSQPTKVVEYMAHGVPVITTPLPRAEHLVTSVGSGVVVPFGAPAVGRSRAGSRGPAAASSDGSCAASEVASAVADVVLALQADPVARLRMGTLGHRHAADHLDWARRSGEFVSRLGAIANAPDR